MGWNIGYIAAVEDWFEKLTNDKLKAVAKELKLLEYCGSELRLPHSKSLGAGLFELRERRFGLRLYYCFQERKAVLVLLGGNKSSQEKDIKKAREALKTITGGSK
ncbi:MAG: type II toxin-antitoxin system RelE/ParE family toxin [Coxiellaceae bacterium]|nr:type II toxin-antitoxin system RelE/ParE family toxin [Coxiellaceae bacterium]